MHVSIVLRAHLPNQVQLYENDADNDAEEEHMNSFFCKYALQDFFTTHKVQLMKMMLSLMMVWRKGQT